MSNTGAKPSEYIDGARGKPPRRLDFILAGAQKTASTWLYQCVRSHPEVCVPRDKREKALYGGRQFRERGEDWYWARFPRFDDRCVVGDASVDYMFDVHAARAVRASGHSPKVVCVLRDPIERAISAYFWMERKGAISGIGLNEAFRRGLWGKDDAIGEIDELFERGRYAAQLRRMMELSGPDRIMVATYDEIVRRPREVLENTFEFLNVDPGFEPMAIHMRPKARQTSALASIIERKSHGNRFVAKVFDLWAQAWSGLGLTATVDALDPDIRRRAREHLEADVRETVEVVRRIAPDCAAQIEVDWRY